MNLAEKIPAPDIKSMLPIFETLSDFCAVFRGNRDIPGANCNGSKLMVFGKNIDDCQVVFQFLAKNHQLVQINIDWLYLACHPQEYIEELLEDINAKCTECLADSRFIIPNTEIIH